MSHNTSSDISPLIQAAPVNPAALVVLTHTDLFACTDVIEMDHRLRRFPVHDFPTMQSESAS